MEKRFYSLWRHHCGPPAKTSEKAEKITIRVRYDKLTVAAIFMVYPIPFIFKWQIEFRARSLCSLVQIVNVWNVDLKIDPSAVRVF